MDKSLKWALSAGPGGANLNCLADGKEVKKLVFPLREEVRKGMEVGKMRDRCHWRGTWDLRTSAHPIPV